MKNLKNRLLNQILLLFMAVSLLYSCTTPEETKLPLKGTYETELSHDLFVNPSNTYRSYPFYSINDLLDSAEIYRQVADFKHAGFGGFYLHSRDGLVTEYLGDDWWKVISAATQSALDHDLNVMYYDEDKWPSGFAGGIIPKMDASFRAKCLARLKLETPLPEGSKVLKKDDQYQYVEYTAEMGNEKFNGTSYVDLMNPKAVEAFIESTYEPYFEKYRSVLKHHNAAIFSDEPHIHARYFDRKTPNEGLYSYSPYVRERFNADNGYDFVDKIDLLFEEKENWQEVRLQYYRAVAGQFEESFTKQIASYCEANGFRYTGHYLGEEKLEKVRDRIGNAMWHYRDMHVPGMDKLGLSISGALITAKSVSSVANQMDTPFRMSELFGISGQNMNFEDRKWIGGWQAIMGINHFIPHLTLYSMKGLRKRDYPPTFSYQQPYWNYNKKIEDYLGRLSYMTTIGRFAPQVLVLHPLESEYVKGTTGEDYNNGFYKLIETLQKGHYDFDLGDEDILSKNASIVEEQLKVGAMSYQTVVLPRMVTIRKSTVDLLLKFIDAGGKVYYASDFPNLVDGVENVELLSQLQSKSIATEPKNVVTKISEDVQPNIVLEDDNGKVFTQLRTVEEGALLQLYNTDHVNSIKIKVKSKFIDDHVRLWDPSTTLCYKLISDKNDFYELEIAPSSTVYLSSGDLSNDAPEMVDLYEMPQKATMVVTLDKPWKGTRLNDNTLTLDFAKYSIDGGKTFSSPEPITGIVGRLSDDKYEGPLQLIYEFDVDDISKNMKLCVEDPAMFSSIQMNNSALDFNNNQWFIDHSFKVADITKLHKQGKNLVLFTLDFRPKKLDSQIDQERYGSEIESIYVFGDFGVRTDKAEENYNTQRNATGDFIERPVYGFHQYSITSENNLLKGNLSLEGYPFYAGAFELSQKFTIEDYDDDAQYFIEFPNAEAISMVVFVNNSIVDTLCWASFKADISEFLNRGNNEISITLVNSLRNLLGPHHQQRGELTRVGPYSFGGTGGFPDPKGDKRWYDLRLQNSPTKIWTDTYYHIPYGFLTSPIITEIHN